LFEPAEDARLLLKLLPLPPNTAAPCSSSTGDSPRRELPALLPLLLGRQAAGKYGEGEG